MSQVSVMRYVLSFLLMLVLATSVLGCKEEKEEAVQKEATETKTPVEEKTYTDTVLFEEEEGVEQESETYQDY